MGKMKQRMSPGSKNKTKIPKVTSGGIIFHPTVKPGLKRAARVNDVLRARNSKLRAFEKDSWGVRTGKSPTAYSTKALVLRKMTPKNMPATDRMLKKFKKGK